MWDPNQYLKYSAERSRPFADLLARVPLENPKNIADLGCGPGNLTRTLLDRWPAAHVTGVDSSADMLEQAKPLSIPGRLDFVQADLAAWLPPEPLDLIVSSAALQWVADHEALLPRLAGLLAPGGTLAIQMPYHFGDPAHLAIEETKKDPRWSVELRGVGLHQNSVQPLAWYIDRLHDLNFTVDAWQTTYMHVLQGDNPVLEWFKGTALRPLLNRLAPPSRDEFLKELGNRYRAAYPARNGVTLLPFCRYFIVAVPPISAKQ